LSSLQSLLDEAVARRDVPFVVGMVADASGPRWTGSAGAAAPGVPAGPGTVFALFSMTKAVGAAAAMILVERGRLDLDAPVERYCREFAAVPRLDGWDGETPRFRAPARKATVRQLATHTAGLAYGFLSAELLRVLRATGLPSTISGRLDALRAPLLFEPGTRWQYGTGLDWLGRVIEAIDGRRIDAFVTAEVLAPLGMVDTAFEPAPAMAPRLASARRRAADGGLEPLDYRPAPHPEYYGLGHALYGTPADYLRFLRMLLGGGMLDGTRILAPETVATLLARQTGDMEVGRLPSAQPRASADLDLFPGTPKSHSLAAIRVEADVPGMRRAGSQGWAGILNTHWWIDPAAGLAGVLMTQTMPFIEPRFMALYEAFERAVYAEHA
jgi:CubicO group peptidase (beta-lactamase class C family)